MIGFVLGYFVAYLAKVRGRSSERFHKAYYRYGFWIGIPFTLVFWIIIYSSEEMTTASCYGLIFLIIVFDVTITYLAWQKCSGKGF